MKPRGRALRKALNAAQKRLPYQLSPVASADTLHFSAAIARYLICQHIGYVRAFLKHFHFLFAESRYRERELILEARYSRPENYFHHRCSHIIPHLYQHIRCYRISDLPLSHSMVLQEVLCLTVSNWFHNLRLRTDKD